MKSGLLSCSSFNPLCLAQSACGDPDLTIFLLPQTRSPLPDGSTLPPFLPLNSSPFSYYGSLPTGHDLEHVIPRTAGLAGSRLAPGLLGTARPTVSIRYELAESAQNATNSISTYTYASALQARARSLSARTALLSPLNLTVRTPSFDLFRLRRTNLNGSAFVCQCWLIIRKARRNNDEFPARRFRNIDIGNGC